MLRVVKGFDEGVVPKRSRSILDEEVSSVHVDERTTVFYLFPHDVELRTLVVVTDHKVTVSTGDRNLAERIRRSVKDGDTAETVVRVIDEVTDELYDRVMGFFKELSRYERLLEVRLDGEDTDVLVGVYLKLVELMRFRRELGFLLSNLRKLRRATWATEEHIAEIRQDVEETLSFVDLTIESTKSFLDLHDKAVSAELNTLVKRLTSISIVLATLTLITGIYGMNFRYLPLAEHPLGFWTINGLMLVVAVLLILLLRKVRYL